MNSQRELKPCPFCGQPPYIREGVNGYGHCETEGCHANRAQVVSLDDPKQIQAWNTRSLKEEEKVGDWPISTDGPNKITEDRRWLARQLMDSKLTEEEAFSVVLAAMLSSSPKGMEGASRDHEQSTTDQTGPYPSDPQTRS